jgi:DNA-binding transcriptional LysR family regulator
MDRLESMSLFVATVQAGSFSAASRGLRLPLPTVSRKVALLESQLGTRLLVRSTRKLSLTDAGVTYLAACKRILEEVRDAERAAAGEYSVPRGDVILTAPVAFGRLHVLPIVCDFLALHPQINVRLLLSDRNQDLLDNQIDIAVRIGSLPDSSLVAAKVGEVTYVVCGSEAFLAAHGTPKTPADLERTPCVSLEALGATPIWTFASQEHGTRSVHVQMRLAVNTAEAVIDAAVAGVGLVRVLSYQTARAIEAGSLRRVLRKYESDPLPVHLIHTGRKPVARKLRAFLDFATPRLRQSLRPRAPHA